MGLNKMKGFISTYFSPNFLFLSEVQKVINVSHNKKNNMQVHKNS